MVARGRCRSPYCSLVFVYLQPADLLPVATARTRGSVSLAPHGDCVASVYMGEATLRVLDAQAPSLKSKLCYEEQIFTVCAPSRPKSRHPPLAQKHVFLMILAFYQ